MIADYESKKFALENSEGKRVFGVGLALSRILFSIEDNGWIKQNSMEIIDAIWQRLIRIGFQRFRCILHSCHVLQYISMKLLVGLYTNYTAV